MIYYGCGLGVISLFLLISTTEIIEDFTELWEQGKVLWELHNQGGQTKTTAFIISFLLEAKIKLVKEKFPEMEDWKKKSSILKLRDAPERET